MRMNPNSLRFRISFLFILVLAIVLVIYSALLFISFKQLLFQELDDSLQAKAQKINNAIVSYLGVLGDDEESFEFSVKRVISQTGEHGRVVVSAFSSRACMRFRCSTPGTSRSRSTVRRPPRNR